MLLLPIIHLLKKREVNNFSSLLRKDGKRMLVNNLEKYLILPNNLLLGVHQLKYGTQYQSEEMYL